MSEPSERARPPYARIVDSIHARIRSGELGPGDRVPSTRQITREWGVAMATATKVISTLRQEGAVEVVPGVGTVVRGSASPSNVPGKARRGTSSAHEDRQGRSDVALSRQAIVRAAIAVVDAEGIDDFSMRRVATEMNVSTMALYRHVAHRTDLVSAMIETTYREAEFPELGEADWREALEKAVRWEWGVFRRHPWLVQLSVTAKPYITPATMGPTERMMRVITAEGASPDTALEVVTILLGFTDGMAAQGLVVEQPATREPDPSHWWHERAPDLSGPAGRDEFPTVSRVSRPPDIDKIFAIGLSRLLDSLAPMIEGAAGE
ncbi:GntR family transcriptional regulator [Spiractinospora alimapuensis]|uniref:GntR family transcriptional regulator n=1 Tax=Spiractinospora alimapuensis TaxID=2820884 RepID=UPI001F2B7E66|nr:GntR family transcriptional regulator [Spiractinospora alimapuensis]QVQ52942.1 GntR family transcriptional regulator [Spiractinospora alimapuensis]